MANLLIRFLLSIVVFYATCSFGFSQQRPLYSQYLYNSVVINPAFAGSHEALSLSASNRSQWSGLDGAPRTFAFASHVLLEPQQLGLGITLNKDQVGIHKTLLMNVSAAYHLKLSANDVLSFGLQAGIRNHKADYLSISGNQPYDPRVAASDPGRTAFDLGAGIYFRNKRLEAGISVPGIIPSNWSATDSVSLQIKNAHWLFFFKHGIPLASSFELVPSLLVQYYPGVPVSVDVGAGVMFHNAVFAGISYRKHESVDFILRASITPQFGVGYCYDLVIGEANALSNASHEISVSYLFTFSRHKIAAPR